MYGFDVRGKKSHTSTWEAPALLELKQHQINKIV